MYKHFFGDGTFFDYAAVGGDIAFEYSNAACFAIRILNAVNNIRTGDNSINKIFAHSLTCY